MGQGMLLYNRTKENLGAANNQKEQKARKGDSNIAGKKARSFSVSITPSPRIFRRNRTASESRDSAPSEPPDFKTPRKAQVRPVSLSTNIDSKPGMGTLEESKKEDADLGIDVRGLASFVSLMLPAAMRFFGYNAPDVGYICASALHLSHALCYPTVQCSPNKLRIKLNNLQRKPVLTSCVDLFA